MCCYVKLFEVFELQLSKRQWEFKAILYSFWKLTCYHYFVTTILFCRNSNSGVWQRRWLAETKPTGLCFELVLSVTEKGECPDFCIRLDFLDFSFTRAWFGLSAKEDEKNMMVSNIPLKCLLPAAGLYKPSHFIYQIPSDRPPFNHLVCVFLFSVEKSNIWARKLGAWFCYWFSAEVRSCYNVFTASLRKGHRHCLEDYHHAVRLREPAEFQHTCLG